MAPGVIPADTYSIERGAQGIAAYAVQKALNSAHVRPRLALDADFGKRTEDAVVSFQEREKIDADGKFGPGTSIAMGVELLRRAGRDHDLPERLLEGIVAMESGMWILAMNRYSPGGIDCGFTQRRVLESRYGDWATVARAFNSLYQLKLLARTTSGKHGAWYGSLGGKTHERAWRLAVLHHNYPYAAERIALDGEWRTSYSTSPQAWVLAIKAHFPDGVQVQTPREWCSFYALGDPAHNEPGQMVKQVTDWG